MKTLLLVSLFVFSQVLLASPTSLYQIQVKDIAGKTVPLSQYQGKVLLIVNTASQCGFTPQLKDLETLYKKYKTQGFEVLAFPSNDFKQDPAANNEIIFFAQKNFEVTFPFFEKNPVSGDQKQSVYKYLVSQKSGSLFKEVKWNFEKFLVGRDGQVVNRWMSITSPVSDDVVKAIEKALSQK